MTLLFQKSFVSLAPILAVIFCLKLNEALLSLAARKVKKQHH